MKLLSIFFIGLLLVSQQAFAALSASTVWEIRQAGSSANGGGYTSGGTDYSMQNAAQLSLTDLAAAGGSGVITSVTGGFTSAMVGNIMHITTTGTGAHFVIGFYEITAYTSGNSVTVDRDPTTGGAGVAGTCAVGGALAAIGNLGSNTAGLGAIAGNTIYVKADANYSIGATDTFAVVGTVGSPVAIIGYKTSRTDGYQGRNVTTDGKLITTNMPNYQYTATNRFNITGAFVVVRAIQFSVAGAGISSAGVVTVGVDSILTQCVITNPSTATDAYGISHSTTARATSFDNDVFMTGASGGATGAAILSSGASQRVIGNRVQMSQATSTGPAISVANSCVVIRNVVIGNGGASGIYANTNSAGVTIDGNTVVGFVDGVKFFTGLTALNLVTNNCLTDNSSNAINATDAATPVYNAYNRLRGVTTISGATAYTALSSIGNVTTSGSAYSDYVNQSGGDYRLISASPATSAGIPAKASMGALQRDQVATSSGASYSQ